MAPVHQIVVDLPDDYTRGIGLVMTHWAYVEYLLRKIAYVLVGVDVERRRVTMHNPTPDHYIQMYRQLLRLNGMQLEEHTLSMTYLTLYRRSNQSAT